MKTKLIFTINGIIHIVMGSFLWIGANIIGKPFTNNSFQLKAPGENLTDGIHMVIASTVDTVGAFNIGIGLMLLIIRNINNLESAKKLLMGHFSLIISVLILSQSYNHFFLGVGAPLPVLILLIISLNLSLYGLKRGTI